MCKLICRQSRREVISKARITAQAFAPYVLLLCAFCFNSAPLRENQFRQRRKEGRRKAQRRNTKEEKY
jgi:hypothetical protein